MYEVFVRDWWLRVTGRDGVVKIKLGPGEESHLAYADSENEARAICREYNDIHDPGELSRKAEYTYIGRNQVVV